MQRVPCLLVFLIGLAGTACGQGSLLTYQGRLTEGGAAAAGHYDLEFRLFDQATGGTQRGDSLARTGVWISNGLFSVELDFGAQAFEVDPLWIEIGVRKTGASGDFAILSPRQRLSSAPFAIRAASASSYGGPVADSQLSDNVALRSADQTFSGHVRRGGRIQRHSGCH